MHSAHNDGSECGVVGTPVVGTRVVFGTLHIELNDLFFAISTFETET